MTYPVIHACPVCSSSLHATKLECSHCDTVIENSFSLSKFANLTAEQMEFLEVFIVSRGNIKVVEKELGISYPTVRSKLNEIITLLGHEEQPNSKSDVIEMLENEEITSDEAINLLKGGEK